MANNMIESEKKKALLAVKEKILEDIKYYEKRIEDFCYKSSSNSYIVDDVSQDFVELCAYSQYGISKEQYTEQYNKKPGESNPNMLSGSEDEFPVIIDPGASVTQLKLEQSSLRTRLQATQELTNLQVLQSEVCVITTDPVLAGEPPVLEPGTWREVTAECRVDLVPFSITFYTHQPHRQFAPTWYRGLRVTPVKAAQEAELTRSVLPALVRPSDAVEVIKNYAEAYRSRRTTLARLADKYANTLFMEPMAEGGYTMKCGNLLELSWRLENKWSPLAPFHHRMKFDLEYMEENYITKITQSHKQLSDPTLTTDERTLLLSNIIAICLEAKVHNEHSESVDSDVETAKKVDKRRTTLDQEVDAPTMKRKKEEVMAPPKYLPKKFKNKTNDNRGTKRSTIESVGSVGKKAKNNNATSDKNGLGDGDKIASHNNGRTNKDSFQQSINVSDKYNQGTVSTGKGTTEIDLVERVTDKEIAAQTKNKTANKKNGNPKLSPEDKTQNTDNKKVLPENNKLTDVHNKNKSKPKGATNTKSVTDNTESGSTVRKSSKAPDAKRNNDQVAKNLNNAKIGGNTNITPVILESANNNEESVAAAKNTQDTGKNEKAKDINSSKKLKAQQIRNSESINTVEKVVEKRKNVAIDKHKDHLANVSHKKTSATSSKKLDRVKSANVASIKNSGHKEIDKVTDAKIIASAKNKTTQHSKETQENIPKNINSDGKTTKKTVLPLKSHNKPKDSMNKITKTGITKVLNSGNTEKENGGVAKKSKIPQKKLSPVSESVLMKNPLRISPRKLASKFKSTSDSNVQTKVQKPATNIPRLMKHVPKAK